MDPGVEIQARKRFGRWRWWALDKEGREIARSRLGGCRNVDEMAATLALLFGRDVNVVIIDSGTNPVAKRNTYEKQWRNA